MAKIYAMPNQKEWDALRDLPIGSDYEKYLKDEAALLAKVPADKIISFGVADGSAMYYVYSMKPLQICHIPYGDAYRADRLIEKALNVTEVKRLLKQQAGMRRLFSSKATA